MMLQKQKKSKRFSEIFFFSSRRLRAMLELRCEAWRSEIWQCRSRQKRWNGFSLLRTSPTPQRFHMSQNRKAPSITLSCSVPLSANWFNLFTRTSLSTRQTRKIVYRKQKKMFRVSFSLHLAADELRENYGIAAKSTRGASEGRKASRFNICTECCCYLYDDREKPKWICIN